MTTDQIFNYAKKEKQQVFTCLYHLHDAAFFCASKKNVVVDNYYSLSRREESWNKKNVRLLDCLRVCPHWVIG